MPNNPTFGTYQATPGTLTDGQATGLTFTSDRKLRTSSESSAAAPVYGANVGPAAGIVWGQKAVTGGAAAVQVRTAATSFKQGVAIKVLSGGPVVLGPSGVTAAVDGTGTGTTVDSGATFRIEIDDMSVIYVYAATNAVVSYVGL